MSGARILIAYELTSYRQVLAEAFRSLRPNVEVFETGSDHLDEEVARVDPDLVVCDSASDRVRLEIPFWVELYVGYEDRSVVSIWGERSIIEQIQLTDLISIVDRTERATSHSAVPRGNRRR